MLDPITKLPTLPPAPEAGNLKGTRSSLDAGGSVASLRSTGAQALGPTAASPDALDDYDPRMAAKQLREERVRQVVDLKTETSKLTATLTKKQRELEKAATDLRQLEIEDDVAAQRARGADQMTAQENRLSEVRADFEAAGKYFYTLEHMFNRLRADKQTHVATLNAFEEALAVQQRELKLQRKLLEQVTTAKQDEQRELQEMQEQADTQRRQIDAKMEARRLEVQARQRLAREKLVAAKKEAELESRVAGDLTQEQEAALRHRTAELLKEASMVGYRKQVLTRHSDELYDLYSAVRMAAGCSAGQLPDDIDPMALPEPQPDDIVSSFLNMQSEMEHVDAELGTLNERIARLHDAGHTLQARLQPRARNVWDEDEYEPDRLDKLTARRDTAKRKLETAKEELTHMNTMRVQFTQAIGALHHRMSLLPVPESSAHTMSSLSIDAVGKKRGSMWASNIAAKLKEIQATLAHIFNVLDASLSVDDEHRNSILGQAAAAGVGQEDKVAHAAADLHQDSMDETKLHLKAKELDATIEALLLSAAMSVRVPARGFSNNGTVSNALVHNAAHHFAQTHTKVARAQKAAAAQQAAIAQGVIPDAAEMAKQKRAVSVSSAPSEPTSRAHTTDYPGDRQPSRASVRDMDPFSREASLQRRRASRMDIQAALAAAVAAAGEEEDHDTLHDAKGKRKKKRGGMKASDVTKFVAAAVDLSGLEVEEYLLAVKDHEDVPTRDKLKRDAARISSDKVRRRRLEEQLRKENEARALRPSKALLDDA